MKKRVVWIIFIVLTRIIKFIMYIYSNNLINLILMKRFYYLLCAILLLLTSCSQEFNEDQNYSSDVTMASFANSSEFLNTFDYLSRLSNSELLLWVEKYNINSVLNTSVTVQDSFFLNIPISLRALFNSDLEVRIGNEVVRFCNGDLFVVTYTNGQTEVKPYGSIKYESEPLFSPATRGELEAVDKVASKQYEFGINANNYRYKYIAQIRSFIINIGGQVNRCVLSLDVKMEYKKSGSWKPAGRTRFVSVDVRGTYERGNMGGEIHVKRSDTWSDGYASYVLASVEVIGPVPRGTFWKYYPFYPHVDTVYQRIEGSPESGYTMRL